MLIEEGRSYGPARLTLTDSLVADFVTATSDGGFSSEGPPAMAAVGLFAVAPRLLADVAAGTATGAVIHGEQSFRWHRPFEVGAELTVTGAVTRVRERGGVHYLSFAFDAFAGDLVASGSSLFLIGGEAAPAGTSAEEIEPRVDESAEVDMPSSLPPPPPGEALPPLRKSVSRAGLVRYAAATRDWNPIHWDHESARAAGLPGVVVHGLLMAAWVCQAVQRHHRLSSPLAEASFRFRAPLRPAVAATVVGSRNPSGDYKMTVESLHGIHVTAMVRPRGE